MINVQSKEVTGGMKRYANEINLESSRERACRSIGKNKKRVSHVSQVSDLDS